MSRTSELRPVTRGKVVLLTTNTEIKQKRFVFSKPIISDCTVQRAPNLILLKTSGNLGNIEKEVKDFLLFVSDIKFEIKYESFDKKIHEPVSWDGSKKNLFGNK